MFYFIYDQGEFFVIREFNDAYDIEIVDIVPFYFVRKIYHWCRCANIEFPYELNDCVCNILKRADSEYDGLDSLEYFLSIFHACVTNGDIKIYCEEKK